MALTDLQVRKAAPADKPRKLFDERGLFLLIQPNGSKWWRFKYQFAGKEKLLSLGTLADVTLKQARQKREEARQLVLAGTDPSDARKEAAKIRSAIAEVEARVDAGVPLDGSFEAVARDWVATVHRAKVSAGHSARTLIRFEQDVFPWIGQMPLKDVTAPKLLAVLRRVEARGAIETTHRIKDSCGQVFRFGIACGLCDRDVARDLRDALRPVNTKHMAAITDPIEVGRLLRAIDAYKGLPVTRHGAASSAPRCTQMPSVGRLRRTKQLA
jgi:hypothetical protein